MALSQPFKSKNWTLSFLWVRNWNGLGFFFYFPFIFISWRLNTVQYCSDHGEHGLGFKNMQAKAEFNNSNDINLHFPKLNCLCN